MDKETLIWTPEGVKVTTVNKVANGVQEITTTLDNGEALELPEPKEEEMLHLYKDTIILALKGRMAKCTKDLVSATKRDVRADKSWTYVDGKECVNTFNYPSYKAMQEAIKLAEEEKFGEFTALMWGQTLKGLAHVNKKWSKAPYPFDTLFGYVMEQFANKMHELLNK